MDVSVGVLAHSEERAIGRVLDSLLSQELEKVRIRDILVVSSGSTDKTNEIVRGYSERDSRIRLLEEPERRGKYSAINLFLREAGTDVVALVSGDVVPGRLAVETLCREIEGGVGIAASRPVPQVHEGALHGVVSLQWKLHHAISEKKPKFGEMIAFRNVIGSLRETTVDEELIGVMIKERGLSSVYVPGAVVRNRGPRTMKDFIKQRRRVYAGHLELARKAGYRPGTMSNMELFRSLRRVSGVRALPAMAGAALEGISRLLGLMDFALGRNHYVWSMVRR